MEYIRRTYRQTFGKQRWRPFTARYKETDLWIGVDPGSYHPGMPAFTRRLIRGIRQEMDGYLRTDPDYATALVSYAAAADAPSLLHAMSAVSFKSGIGPMSAVAGAVAQAVGEALTVEFGVREVIVENGGDIYASLAGDLDVSVFAGTSPLSGKVGIRIEAAYSPLGICTSSGTVGPSLSFGKADAVMIVCRDALLADTYATAFANGVTTPEDIAPCLEKIRECREVLSALVIKDDRMGVCGRFGLKLF